MSEAVIQATGRRKESTCQVRMKPGTGKTTVNGKDMAAYLCRANLFMHAMRAIEVAELQGKMDIECKASRRRINRPGRGNQPRHCPRAR